MNATLPLVLLGGLLGSSHCIGMCGPFALMISGGATSWTRSLLRQTTFTAGRIFTYAVFGAVAGSAGLYLERQLPTLVNVASVLAMAAGLFLIYQGLVAARVLRPRGVGGEGSCLMFGPQLASLFRSPRATHLFLAGMLTGMLPCGLVYGFVALAASTRDLAYGAALMACFGLGTAPVMMATGCGASLLSAGVRRRLFAVAAWCVVLTGALSIARGAGFLQLTPEADPAACPFCRSES